MIKNLRGRIVDQSGKFDPGGADNDQKIVDYVASEGGAERFAEELKAALDSVAADTRTERRNRELSNRVKELEREVERLKSGK